MVGKNKNITVYIDMANLYSECMLKGFTINMDSMFKWLMDKYCTKDVYIFTGYLVKYENQYQVNEKIGYKYIFKEAVFNKDEKKIKANCDVDIAIKGVIDTIEDGLFRAVLITSDGDFLSLINFWKCRNVDVKIISPADPERCSYLLKKDNTTIIYLRQIINKFINEKALDEDKTS